MKNKELCDCGILPIWLDEEKTHWCHIDEKGREYPCDEYWYDDEPT